MEHMQALREALLSWYGQCRRALPWRQTSDPYRIWLSEIMLQQTRVETVKDYYARFLAAFPDVRSLAEADEQSVLKLWEGLGYYSRARHLHAAAKAVCERHGGQFPADIDQLLALPGVGAYTAGAIGSIAFGLRVPAIDGNVLRVTARCFGLHQDIGTPAAQKAIRQLQRELLPEAARAGDYNQALMDLGATVCTPRSPKCEVCPWRKLCAAHRCGEEETLPIHEKKQPPRVVHVTVCLMMNGSQVWVEQRKEALLKGLSVFLLIEGEHPLTPEEVMAALTEKGFSDAKLVSELGHAKHVFTHRVWEMDIRQYATRQTPAEGGRFVGMDELKSLPFPTAMRAALTTALKLLQSSDKSD